LDWIATRSAQSYPSNRSELSCHCAGLVDALAPSSWQTVEQINQPVVVENRPGAAAYRCDVVAKSAPDGYHSPEHGRSGNCAGDLPTLPFDALKDFVR